MPAGELSLVHAVGRTLTRPTIGMRRGVEVRSDSPALRPWVSALVLLSVASLLAPFANVAMSRRDASAASAENAEVSIESEGQTQVTIAKRTTSTSVRT